MNRTISILLLLFGVMSFGIVGYPVYSSLKLIKPPMSMHEYTALDPQTGQQFITWADDNEYAFRANDTAYVIDRKLYSNTDKPVNSRKVLIVATFNQLYE